MSVCDISSEVKEEIQKFRFRKNLSNAALILKIDKEKQLVIIDESYEDMSIDDLVEELPSHQPRFIVYSYKMFHDDGRISYPMCFIFFTPRDSQTELQVLYAGTKKELQREVNLTRVYEIRELEELNEEWLKEKLK